MLVGLLGLSGGTWGPLYRAGGPMALWMDFDWTPSRVYKTFLLLELKL